MSKKTHEHRCVPNSDECFETFVGCTLLGTFLDHKLEGACRWLVFDCGWSLVMDNNGAHWTEDPKSTGESLARVTKKTQQGMDWLDGALRVLGVRK